MSLLGINEELSIGNKWPTQSSFRVPELWLVKKTLGWGWGDRVYTYPMTLTISLSFLLAELVSWHEEFQIFIAFVDQDLGEKSIIKGAKKEKVVCTRQ